MLLVYDTIFLCLSFTLIIILISQNLSKMGSLIPESFKPFFSGGTLTPIHKPPAGIRPIVSGLAIRRIVAR